MKAITFFFEGPQVPTRTIGFIVEHMMNTSDRKVLYVGQLDDNDMLQINVKASAGVAQIQKDWNDDTTPAHQAIIYIGNLFKNAHTDDSFKRALMHKALELSSRPDSEECKRLMNAMFILSQDSISVKASVMNQHNMSPTKIGMVRRVYNAITKL
jgi:hypothetical protein